MVATENMQNPPPPTAPPAPFGINVNMRQEPQRSSNLPLIIIGVLLSIIVYQYFEIQKLNSLKPGKNSELKSTIQRLRLAIARSIPPGKKVEVDGVDQKTGTVLKAYNPKTNTIRVFFDVGGAVDVHPESVTVIEGDTQNENTDHILDLEDALRMALPAGTRVVLNGLSGKMREFNGREGTVYHAYDLVSHSVEVQLDDDDDSLMVNPSNIQRIEEVSSDSSSTASILSSMYSKGKEVRIVKGKLNGKRGKIHTAYSSQSGKVTVTVNGKQHDIPIDHITLVKKSKSSEEDDDEMTNTQLVSKILRLEGTISGLLKEGCKVQNIKTKKVGTIKTSYVVDSDHVSLVMDGSHTTTKVPIEHVACGHFAIKGKDSKSRKAKYFQNI